MAGRHTVGGPVKKDEGGTRYVIEFEDGSKKYYASGQTRYQAFKELRDQGRAYLIKRQYITGVQGAHN